MTNSIFKVTATEDLELQEYKDTAIKELNEFFNKRWVHNTPKVFIIDDRKTIDLLREEKTEDWVVGWSWGKNAIFILNPNNISSKSSHNGNTYNIRHLIKHELCHAFLQLFVGESKFMWINEGVSLYAAGQLENYDKPKKFDGFLDENENKIYQESGYVIKLIIDNFGKEKLFEFLKNQSNISELEELNSLFEKVFGAKLDYSFFNGLINKTDSH